MAWSKKERLRRARQPPSVKGFRADTSPDRWSTVRATQTVAPTLRATQTVAPQPSFASERDRKRCEENEAIREAQERFLREGKRREPDRSIVDQQLQTILEATSRTDAVGSDLAEAQLGLLQRCAVCGKRQFLRHHH